LATSSLRLHNLFRKDVYYLTKGKDYHKNFANNKPNLISWRNDFWLRKFYTSKTQGKWVIIKENLTTNFNFETSEANGYQFAATNILGGF
ncbi:MAG: hypothetical protein AAB336_12470, partial [Acidobacteriota bacterium]